MKPITMKPTLIMKPILTTLLLLTALPCFAQNQTPASVPNRSPADGPFTPQAIVPGGIILPLYAPTKANAPKPDGSNLCRKTINS